MSNFKVGMYIRLSRDDGNIESDSVVSQRNLTKAIQLMKIIII